MIDYQEHDRDKAVRDVLAMVRHPIAVLSAPDRECAYALADFHKITAVDLLDAAVDRVKRRS